MDFSYSGSASTFFVSSFRSQTFVHHVFLDWTWEFEGIAATLIHSGTRYLVLVRLLVTYLVWKHA